MHTEDVIHLVHTTLDDMKAKDRVTLNVTDKTSVTDYMVIVSGTSRRHILSMANEVIEKIKEAGMQPLGTEGQESADWILVDLGDVLVHIMMPETRSLYDLERLWRLTPDDLQQSNS